MAYLFTIFHCHLISFLIIYALKVRKRDKNEDSHIIVCRTQKVSFWRISWPLFTILEMWMRKGLLSCSKNDKKKVLKQLFVYNIPSFLWPHNSVSCRPQFMALFTENYCCPWCFCLINSHVIFKLKSEFRIKQVRIQKSKLNQIFSTNLLIRFRKLVQMICLQIELI